jgi:hypothetical protein
MGFVALLGIIALAGMIIRNAVILISEVDVGMKNGFTADEAIKVAALHRSRPIMLTASAAILGMLPIAGMFSGDRWHLPLLVAAFSHTGNADTTAGSNKSNLSLETVSLTSPAVSSPSASTNDCNPRIWG